MIKVKGRHVLEYNLDNAVNSNVDEIILVVGYRAEDIINHFGNSYKNKAIKYVIQWEQKGLVHAIECARETIDGDDFMLMLGDEILLNPKHQEMLDEFKKEEAVIICGILWVDDKNQIKKTYTLIQNEESMVHRLIEKPRNPLNNYMGTGDCVFHSSIFDYIDVTPIHHERNEKELPDLIQCVIDEGSIVKSFTICDKYTNINTKEDIKMAESFLK